MRASLCLVYVVFDRPGVFALVNGELGFDRPKGENATPKLRLLCYYIAWSLRTPRGGILNRQNGRALEAF